MYIELTDAKATASASHTVFFAPSFVFLAHCIQDARDFKRKKVIIRVPKKRAMSDTNVPVAAGRSSVLVCCQLTCIHPLLFYVWR